MRDQHGSVEIERGDFVAIVGSARHKHGRVLHRSLLDPELWVVEHYPGSGSGEYPPEALAVADQDAVDRRFNVSWRFWLEAR